jgi:hypothetical protein
VRTWWSFDTCFIALTAGPFDTRLIVLAASPLGESPALLVAWHLESRARILVRSAWPPTRSAPFPTTAARHCLARLLLRLPQPAAREPHHHGIGMAGLQLLERG